MLLVQLNEALIVTIDLTKNFKKSRCTFGSLMGKPVATGGELPEMTLRGTRYKKEVVFWVIQVV